MANAFSDSGYKTGFFGKWHLGDNYPFRPEDRGFQEVLRHGGGGVGQTPDYWGNDYFDDTYFHNGRAEKQSGYCTDVWFDGAIGFIEKNKNNPFFCYLSTNAPHGPYLVSEKYKKPYAENANVPNAAFYDERPRLSGSTLVWAGSDGFIGSNDSEVFLRQGDWMQSFLPPLSIDRLADHIVHAIETAGIEHIGIGSDFDGILRRPAGLEDASGYPLLAEALRGRGLGEDELRAVFWENMARVYRTATGAGTRAASRTSYDPTATA